MNKTEKEIQDIQDKYRRHIERLEKRILNMYAVSNIRYWYWCLSNFKKSPDLHEDIMQMEAFTTSIVVSYGNLFGGGTGATMLAKEDIPKELQQVHKSIINLRHARYAHHGEHETINKNIQIEFNDSSFIVTPKMEFIVCLGAPKEWEPLFKWLDEYMHESLNKTLDFLSKETGVKWEIHSGPAPHWI